MSWPSSEHDFTASNSSQVKAVLDVRNILDSLLQDAENLSFACFVLMEAFPVCSRGKYVYENMNGSAGIAVSTSTVNHRLVVLKKLPLFMQCKAMNIYLYFLNYISMLPLTLKERFQVFMTPPSMSPGY